MGTSPRPRPITWRELTTAFVALLAAVDQALVMNRLPTQTREILTEAQSRAGPLRSRIREESPGRRR